MKWRVFSFFINDRQLKGLDPFLEGSPHHKRNPKTDEGKPVEMAVKYYDKGYEKEAMIKVQTFILPHQDDLSKEDVEALGGMEVLKDEQGFFVYRNDRLIIYGTWFRLSSRSVNAELYKYGRIKVDIPNKLDSLWDIDIKKQNAVIPKQIVNLLRKSVMRVCSTSKEKTGRRVKLNDGENEEQIEDYMRNSLISALYESYELEYADNNWFGKTATWDQVFERLPEAIKDIEIAVVNSSRNSNKLDYSKHERDGLRVIAIGGLALSRGLTLEGLCVSYFYRNTATFDVLMQMGRWFGYRDDYGDMCKIYLTDFSYRYYREISQSIDQLKKDIRTMGAQGKRPEDYGIRVRNNSSEMGITAANKMRNTKAKIDRKSFYGSVFETPYLHRSLSAVSENIDHTSAFLRELTVAQKDDSVQHPYIRDISARRVFELLQVLNIHEANENFDTKQLCRFIAKHLEMKFDVLVMGGAAENTPIEGFEPVFTDTCVKRRFDIVNRDEYLDQQIIRINGVRAHLWGPRDTANGLSEADRKRVESQTSVKAQDYMLEGRNALLIIYFIQPSNEGVDIDDYFTAENTMEEEVKSQVKLLLEMRQKNMKYLVGYGIGFPHKQGLSGDATNYIVNKTCNYYTKQHEEDYQTYGEI